MPGPTTLDDAIAYASRIDSRSSSSQPGAKESLTDIRRLVETERLDLTTSNGRAIALTNVRTALSNLQNRTPNTSEPALNQGLTKVNNDAISALDTTRIGMEALERYNTMGAAAFDNAEFQSKFQFANPNLSPQEKYQKVMRTVSTFLETSVQNYTKVATADLTLATEENIIRRNNDGQQAAYALVGGGRATDKLLGDMEIDRLTYQKWRRDLNAAAAQARQPLPNPEDRSVDRFMPPAAVDAMRIARESIDTDFNIAIRNAIVNTKGAVSGGENVEQNSVPTVFRPAGTVTQQR